MSSPGKDRPKAIDLKDNFAQRGPTQRYTFRGLAIETDDGFDGKIKPQLGTSTTASWGLVPPRTKVFSQQA